MSKGCFPFISSIFLVVIAFDCCSLSAQTPTNSEKGRAQFKRLDKNGDGNVSAAEANGGAWFKLADKNGDGLVTPEEGLVYRASTDGGKKRADEVAKKRAVTSNANSDSSSTVLVRVLKDIRYQETAGIDPIDQSLDIYAPENAQKAPVMIYVHGGGWSKGDKSNVDASPKFFNKAGWIFVSINYRLLPAGKHPHNIQDVASAVAWVHSHIAEYGGDPDKIFLYGHSAGAHLVALLATDSRRLKEAGKDLGILRGVIPLDTNVYNLPELIKTTGAFYGEIFGSDPDVLRDASPFEHVAADQGIPPMLIFHSGTGAEQRSAQGKAFLAKLKDAGVSAELIPSLGQSHGDINRQFGTPGDMVTEAVWEFLNSNSKESKQ